MSTTNFLPAAVVVVVVVGGGGGGGGGGVVEVVVGVVVVVVVVEVVVIVVVVVAVVVVVVVVVVLLQRHSATGLRHRLTGPTPSWFCSRPISSQRVKGFWSGSRQTAPSFEMKKSRHEVCVKYQTIRLNRFSTSELMKRMTSQVGVNVL